MERGFFGSLFELPFASFGTTRVAPA